MPLRPGGVERATMVSEAGTSEVLLIRMTRRGKRRQQQAEDLSLGLQTHLEPTLVAFADRLRVQVRLFGER